MVAHHDKDLTSLIHLSARIGRQPLLVQGSTGNTSLKVGGTLWIKASGKWMANASREEMFVPVSMADADRYFSEACRPPAPDLNAHLQPSIETAMHLILPHRVVIHVHSVNTISWAVQQAIPPALHRRLEGLSWCWIPYTPSGAPLARSISAALHLGPDVFVLANHGLVVAGDTCEMAEALLREVEDRLSVVPRPIPSPQTTILKQLAASSGFQPADAPEIHALGTDALCTSRLSAGVMFPCQAMFLGRYSCVLSSGDSIPGLVRHYRAHHGFRPPAILVPGQGVLVASDLTLTESQMLCALSELARRIPPGASVSYLTPDAVNEAISSSAVYLGRRVTRYQSEGALEAPRQSA